MIQVFEKGKQSGKFVIQRTVLLRYRRYDAIKKEAAMPPFFVGIFLFFPSL